MGTQIWRGDRRHSSKFSSPATWIPGVEIGSGRRGLYLLWIPGVEIGSGRRCLYLLSQFTIIILSLSGLACSQAQPSGGKPSSLPSPASPAVGVTSLHRQAWHNLTSAVLYKMITCPVENQFNLLAESLFFLKRSRVNCSNLYFPGKVLKRMPESDRGHPQGDSPGLLNWEWKKWVRPLNPSCSATLASQFCPAGRGVVGKELGFFFPGGLSGERTVGHMTQDNCRLPQVLGDLTHLSWLNGIKRLEKQEARGEQCCNVGAVPGCQWPSRLRTHRSTRAPGTLTSARLSEPHPLSLQALGLQQYLCPASL